MKQHLQIDLLYALSHENAAGHQTQHLWIAGGLSALLLLNGFALYQAKVEITRLDGQISGLQEKKRFLTKEMGATEAAMKDVVHSLALTLSERVRWSQLMQEVSLLIPKGVWTAQFESLAPQTPAGRDMAQKTRELEKPGIQMRIRGESLSQEQLILFLSRLDRSPLLSASRLDHAREMDGEIQFEIIVDLKTEERS